MGVFLGGLASLFWGVGDFLGGQGAKRAPAASVVLWAGAISFPVVTAIAVLAGGTVSAIDVGFGAAAGAGGAIGLVFLFAGLGRGQAAAVAPASGALTGIFPVVVAVLIGERPSTLAWIGVALAIPAIILCSWVADPGGVPYGGLWYGVIAGLGFGTYTIMISATSEGSELLPLIPARAATMVVVGLFALLGLWKVTGFAKVPRAIVIGSGLFDVGANITLLLGLRFGSLALVSVASSLFPAVTVVLARFVNHEYLHGRQIFGLVMTLVAISAIALG